MHFDDVAAELAASGPRYPGSGANSAVRRHEVASAQLREFIRNLMGLRDEASDPAAVYQAVGGMDGLTAQQIDILRERIETILSRLGNQPGPNGAEPAASPRRPPASTAAPVTRKGPPSIASRGADSGNGDAPGRRPPVQPAAPASARPAAAIPASVGDIRAPVSAIAAETASARDSVLTSLAAKCLEQVRADLCQVFTNDEEGNLALRAEAPSDSDGVPGPRALTDASGFAAKVARAAGPISLGHRSELVGAEAVWLDRGMVKLAAAPIGGSGDPANGILVIARTSRRAFGESDLSTLSANAAEVSVALTTADLLGRAEELAVLKERMNLAREIHDGLASDLSAVVALFKYHELRREIDPADAENILVQMRELVVNSLQSARDILATLRPSPQVPRRLAEAARRHVEEFAQTYGITAIMRILGEDDQLDVDERDALFQVLREALTNVRKHAQAKTINITLDIRHRPYSLVVEDDGIGVDLGQAEEKAGSFGLMGMRERAALIGGDIEINKGGMGGTRVAFYGPPEQPAIGG